MGHVKEEGHEESLKVIEDLERLKDCKGKQEKRDFRLKSQSVFTGIEKEEG